MERSPKKRMSSVTRKSPQKRMSAVTRKSPRRSLQSSPQKKSPESNANISLTAAQFIVDDDETITLVASYKNKKGEERSRKVILNNLNDEDKSLLGGALVSMFTVVLDKLND